MKRSSKPFSPLDRFLDSINPVHDVVLINCTNPHSFHTKEKSSTSLFFIHTPFIPEEKFDMVPIRSKLPSANYLFELNSIPFIKCQIGFGRCFFPAEV
jgi:hypothetical protein